MIASNTTTNRDQQDRFLSYINDIYDSLKQYDSFIDVEGIIKISENFQDKIEDFYRENRKFNIAVIGQVKAGKSSFLNTLLFKGASLLPYAPTPKTSTLTMIEYSKQNCINVEFYDVYEWAELKKNARSTFDTPQVLAARDILEMAQNSRVDIDECFSIQRLEKKIVDLDDINLILEDYVGESGSYTPYVKSVTLKVNIAEIKNITIVDTPGLNDPVSSRRVKTQDFIERCDAAFYLSRASYFMDSNDIELITSQLPQKGVKKLILIGSQYDNALLDIMSEGVSFSDAHQQLKNVLAIRAKECVKHIGDNLLKNGCSKEVVEVLNDCNTPYYISAVAHAMATTPKNSYNDLCNHIYTQLSKNSRITKANLKSISGFNAVNDTFLQMVSQKNELLKDKELSFAVVANSELKHYLNRQKDILLSNIEKFEDEQFSTHRDELKQLNGKIIDIKEKINRIFSECYSDIEQSSFDNATRLFESRAQIKPNVKNGIEVVNVGVWVSDRVWWNPLSWNKEHKEYITRQKTYEYAHLKDAIDEIDFIEQGARELYKSLGDELMAADGLREQLVKELLTHANSNGCQLGRMLDKSLRKLVLSPLQINFDDYKKPLILKYDEKVLDKEKAHAMISESEEVVKRLVDDITRQIINNLRSFTMSTKNASSLLCDLVLSKQYAQQKELSNNYEKNLKSMRVQQEALEVISQYV